MLELGKLPPGGSLDGDAARAGAGARRRPGAPAAADRGDRRRRRLRGGGHPARRDPVRFGSSSGAADKWAAAAAVLADPKLDALTYVDVRVPERPRRAAPAPAPVEPRPPAQVETLGYYVNPRLRVEGFRHARFHAAPGSRSIDTAARCPTVALTSRLLRAENAQVCLQPRTEPHWVKLRNGRNGRVVLSRGDQGRRRRRRWHQRGQPHGRRRAQGRRVHRHQHRRAGAAVLRGGHQARRRATTSPTASARAPTPTSARARRRSRATTSRRRSRAPTWSSSPPARAAAPAPARRR